MKSILILFAFAMMIFPVQAQNITLPLWNGTPPLQKEMDLNEEVVSEGIIRIGNVQIPTIEVYLPAKQIATGQAVVIFPGGGYSILAYDWEGTDFAKWLNSQGIAGIVVKYRLPKSASLTDPKEVPLMDAQRAIRLVRQNASGWNIDPTKVGIMGFSAGGHLASTLSTQYSHTVDRAMDAIDALSARPDFSILVYPVITFVNPAIHSGSMKALLGENQTEELKKRFSAELNVTEETPVTFLVHAGDDTGVPVENSLLYYAALRAKGHGFAFGMGKGPVENWRDILLDWMKAL
jgi:acetyl esterase/lipase